MSRVVHIAGIDAPHAQVAGLPNGDRVMIFPGHCESSVDRDPQGFTAFPMMEERALWNEIWRRVKKMKSVATMSWASGAITANHIATIDRAIAVTDEEALCSPSHYQWSGAYEPSPTEGIIYDIEFMGTAAPAFYWRKDQTPPKMLPRFLLNGSVSIETGGEVSGSYGSGPEPPVLERTADYFTTTASFFGIVVPIWVNCDNPCDTFVIEITGQEWFEYRGGPFDLPKWDKDTGAKLAPSWPPYA
jgi:hypothetical protein